MKLKHIAIIMDGNGRWAKHRKRPRTYGHQKGVKAVKTVIEACLKSQISHLTLFAFSRENWSRPANEVNKLMQLFLRALKRETSELRKQGVQLNFIGELLKFDDKLQQSMQQAQMKIPISTKLHLNIAVNYGGQWDVMQACQRMCHEVTANNISPDEINEEMLSRYLSLHPQPNIDLLIRTGGEKRISNFLLWQIAYAELCFSDTLWPDFDQQEFNEIITSYYQRERRFGKISEQINA